MVLKTVSYGERNMAIYTVSGRVGVQKCIYSTPLQITTSKLTNCSVLTRPEHIQTVFRDSDKHSKATDNNSGYIMSQLLGSCVGLINGKEWNSVRKVIEVAFLHQNVSSYIPMINDHIERHFCDLEKQSLHEGQLHTAEDLKMLPLWIIAEILYGQLPPNLIKELESFVPIRDKLFSHVI